MDISSSITSLLGKNNINPEVGFGVVGTKTDNKSSLLVLTLCLTSPYASVEINPIAQMP